MTVMRRSFLGLALLSIGLIGCSPDKVESNTPIGSNAANADASDASPLNLKMAPTDPPKPNGTAEVQAFKGGYGIDFFQRCAADYNKAHPGSTVTVDGNPEVWLQLKPRIANGNPPDLIFPGWGMDHWGLAEDGQVFDLTDVLKTPGADGKTPWGETFIPELLKLGQLDGKQVALPLYLMMYGWWFDPDVFAKNGWTPPKTWDELMVLAPKIKAKGMAPITFQGKYPFYMVYGMLMPWTQGHGGMGAINACQNMMPGAWKSESVLKAAKMIEELRDKGFFEDGAVSLTHTQAQTDFLNGKAAMVPCGTWIKSEMKDHFKPGQKVTFFLPPAVVGGKGDPTAIQVDIEPWLVPVKAKNPQLGIDYYKSMTSLENAKRFVREKATYMSVKGSSQTEIPEELKAPADAFNGSKTVWSIKFRSWYKVFEKELEDSMTALITKKVTATEFCDRVEKAAQAVREDDQIKKHKV